MMHRWAARLFVLALLVVTARPLEAQGQQSSRDATTGSELRQNFPNPFNPETHIPFRVGGFPNCIDPARQYRVSLRIFNLLGQPVATPLLQGGAAGVAGGERLENVMLPCGDYTAYWDGKLQGSNREAPSGIYAYRLEVDGRPITRKMTIRK